VYVEQPQGFETHDDPDYFWHEMRAEI
jgi:hypothetical protein